jgi:hypothetical protein
LPGTPPVWPAACPRPSNTCSEAGLTVAFATIFAERLQRVPLTGDAGLLARRIGLLSPDYERIAQSAVAQNAAERTAFAIARGQPVEAPTATIPATGRRRRVFRHAAPHRYAWFLDNDRMGEAFLRAPSCSATGRAIPATSATR